MTPMQSTLVLARRRAVLDAPSSHSRGRVRTPHGRWRSVAVVRACGFGCKTVVHDAQIAPGVSVNLALTVQDYLRSWPRIDDLPTERTRAEFAPAR